jgi:hypothetical protein
MKKNGKLYDVVALTVDLPEYGLKSRFTVTGSQLPVTGYQFTETVSEVIYSYRTKYYLCKFGIHNYSRVTCRNKPVGWVKDFSPLLLLQVTVYYR